MYNPSYGLYFRPEPAPVPIYRDLSEPIDDADLLNWVIDNASKGSTWAATELGMRYLEGRGVKQNFEVGKTWLVKSAKEGDNEAYTVLKNTDFPSESPNATPKKDYMEATGWPSGKPGYVIMLKREPDKGGTYSVDNMQWLPIEDAKKKDPLLIDALKKTLKEN